MVVNVAFTNIKTAFCKYGFRKLHASFAGNFSVNTETALANFAGNFFTIVKTALASFLNISLILKAI